MGGSDDLTAIDWHDEEERRGVPDEELQCKHLLCSECFYELISRVLDRPPKHDIIALFLFFLRPTASAAQRSHVMSLVSVCHVW